MHAQEPPLWIVGHDGLDIDRRFDFGGTSKLPVEVLGALVVIETAEQTSTALIVKSIDTIYKGDRVELKKGK